MYGNSCGKCSTCIGDGAASRNGAWGKMRRRITGAPKPIHRVTVNYTVEDIVFMEPVVASSNDNAPDSTFTIDDGNDTDSSEKIHYYFSVLGSYSFEFSLFLEDVLH